MELRLLIFAGTHCGNLLLLGRRQKTIFGQSKRLQKGNKNADGKIEISSQSLEKEPKTGPARFSVAATEENYAA